MNFIIMILHPLKSPLIQYPHLRSTYPNHKDICYVLCLGSGKGSTLLFRYFVTDTPWQGVVCGKTTTVLQPDEVFTRLFKNNRYLMGQTRIYQYCRTYLIF